MGSPIEELQRREAAARREADELRGEIAQLNERLAQAEEGLSRLEITRETVAEILAGVGADQLAAGQAVDAVGVPGRRERLHQLEPAVHQGDGLLSWRHLER